MGCVRGTDTPRHSREHAPGTAPEQRCFPRQHGHLLRRPALPVRPRQPRQPRVPHAETRHTLRRTHAHHAHGHTTECHARNQTPGTAHRSAPHDTGTHAAQESQWGTWAGVVATSGEGRASCAILRLWPAHHPARPCGAATRARRGSEHAPAPAGTWRPWLVRLPRPSVVWRGETRGECAQWHVRRTAPHSHQRRALAVTCCPQPKLGQPPARQATP